jgi:hypothetical protein
MTGDWRYLEPVRAMAKARSGYLRDPVEDPRPGSEAWCASRMGFLASTLGKYRLLTGDSDFDPLLEQDANGYVTLRLGGGRERLVEDLRRQAEAYRVNREAFCEEVRWTDRLVAFRRYANDFLEAPLPAVDPGFVYSTVTGDPGGALYFPMNAVRWKTRPDDIAALVTDSGTEGLEAELFHFGSAPRKMGAELYLLARGAYGWSLANGAGDVLATSSLEVSGPRASIRFELPPGVLCTLTVRASPREGQR